MLKEISDEEAEILIETDAKTEINFEEETDLAEKLTRADNAVALIVWFKSQSDINKLLFSIEAFEFFAEITNFWAKIVIETRKLADTAEKSV